MASAMCYVKPLGGGGGGGAVYDPSIMRVRCLGKLGGAFVFNSLIVYFI